MGLLDDAIKEHLELKRRHGADAGEISRLETEALGPVRRSAEGVPDLADTFEPPADEPATTVDAPDTGDVSEVEPIVAASPPPPPPYEPPPAPPASAYEPPPVPPAPAPEPIDPPTLASSAPAYEPPPVSPPPIAPPPISPPVTPPPPAREAWMTDDLPPEPDPYEPPHREPEPEPESHGLLSRLRGRRAKHEPEPEREPDPYEPPPAPRQSFGAAPPVQHEPDIVPADDEPDVEDLLEETPEFLEETPEHDRLWFEQRPPRDFNFDD